MILKTSFNHPASSPSEILASCPIRCLFWYRLNGIGCHSLRRSRSAVPLFAIFGGCWRSSDSRQRPRAGCLIGLEPIGCIPDLCRTPLGNFSLDVSCPTWCSFGPIAPVRSVSKPAGDCRCFPDWKLLPLVVDVSWVMGFQLPCIHLTWEPDPLGCSSWSQMP